MQVEKGLVWYLKMRLIGALCTLSRIFCAFFSKTVQRGSFVSRLDQLNYIKDYI